MILSPNDSPINDSQSDAIDGNFGGNREVTDGDRGKSHDYKSPSGGSPSIEKNPVEETFKDIDEAADPTTRKREFSRREETSNPEDHNKEGFHSADSGNRPLEDMDATASGVPIKYMRSKIKGHYGSGQYDNNPNRGTYEGEIS